MKSLKSEDLVPFLTKNISKLCLQFTVVHLQKTPLPMLIDAKSLCSTLPYRNHRNPGSKHKTRPTSMKSKAQMSRFHNWVNHVIRPCAFVVKLQADFDIEPISGLASFYPGWGAALS